MQKLIITCLNESLHTFDTFFPMCPIFLTNLDYVHQLCFPYMLNCPAIYHYCPSEIKQLFICKELCLSSNIEKSSYYQKLVSHPMPECFDEMGS